MSLDILLLILRAAIAISLYLFLGALFWMLWRDVRQMSEQMAAAQRSLGRLVVMTCDEEVPLEVGRTFPLRPRTQIGRGPTNTVILPDSFASTEHAFIELRGGQWWLDDRGSRNGTTVNHLPVTQPMVLSSNDVIGVGRVQLRIEIDQ